MVDLEGLDKAPLSRSQAEALAEALAEPEGLADLRQAQRRAAAEETFPEAHTEALRRRLQRALERAGDPQGDPQPISLWQPQKTARGLVFRRPEPGPWSDHFASRREIPASKAPGIRRLCYFGESAAAGYLYAPHLTPARVLEASLATGLDEGEPPWEVIDLARTDERLGSLAETVVASLQLDPDVLVIYTGNNWTLLETPELSPYWPSIHGRQAVAAALQEGLEKSSGTSEAPSGSPYGPLLRLAQSRLAERVELAFDAISRAAAAVPVVLVLPPVNLRDWPAVQPPPWLPEVPGTSSSTSSTPPGISSYVTMACLDSPRAGDQVHGLLAAQARRLGFGLVDLPERFSRACGEGSPGRRLFLDYCHLSREGMHLAMDAVAAEVAARTGSGWEGAPAGVGSPEITPEAEATTFLGAAVHTAHRLLSDPPGAARELVGHWARRALETSPGIRAAMLSLIEARLAPGPGPLTRAQVENLASPFPLTPQHGWHWDHLDPELLRVLFELLVETAADPAELSAVGDLEGRLVRLHAVGSRPKDLSRAPYLWQPLAQLYPDAMAAPGEPRQAFLRCPWPEVSFALISDGWTDLDLELTARLGAPGRVTLHLGGEQVGAWELTETWTEVRTTLPRPARGLHRLGLRWPLPQESPRAALRKAQRALEMGYPADLHPIYGDVFSLRARKIAALTQSR